MPTIECVHDANAIIGESPVWDHVDGVLWWVDIEGCKVHRFDPSGDRREWDIGERPGCLTLRETGGALVATESGLYTFDTETGARAKIADPEADRPQNRFNDGATDPRGRWWFGSAGMMRPQRPESAFWRMDADHTITKVFDNVFTTNGMAFAPDGQIMYLSDSFHEVQTVWSCDYDLDTGTPTNRRVFFDMRAVAGRPDGATVDADGCYWLAGVSGWQVYRFTPDGRLDMTIDMPVEKPSRPMFGGADLKTLYITSISEGLTPGREQPLAGALFAITGLPVGGLPVPRFAG